MAEPAPLHNELITRNSSGGGSVQVVIPADPYKVQANAGVSRPCRYCILVGDSANTTATRVQIGAACTSTTGILIPKASTTTGTTYLKLTVDDVNLLYFLGGTDGDLVDILWFN